MTSVTGDDVAGLHRVADTHECSWVTVHGLPIPYLVDEATRMVYVDGRLEIHRYYEAIREGLGELTRTPKFLDATVIPLQPRLPGIPRRTG